MNGKSDNMHRAGTFLAVCCLLGACAGSREVSYTSGGVKQTFSEGGSAVPKKFSLPLYPKASTQGSVLSEDQTRQDEAKFLMLTTNDSVAKVAKYYRDALNAQGWQVENVQDLPTIVNIAGKRAHEEASVMITGNEGKTTISLGITTASSSGDAGVAQTQAGSNKDGSPVLHPGD